MLRAHRLPRPPVLLALAAGLWAGACGGTLYDANGVPRLDPNGCGAGTHACGVVCKADTDPDACGLGCTLCGGAPTDGVRACVPVGTAGDGQCGFTCNDGFHACGASCRGNTDVHACGAACADCGAGPANGAAVCADQGGGTFACDYTCDPGLFKVNGGCARPTAVAAGQQHSCAIVEGGALLCWGANGSGQLGPAASGATSLAPRLVFANGVTAVAAGGRHTCAVASGVVACWGANDLGQLGRGTTGAATATPAAVSGALTGVSQLAAGADHTCALTSAGAVRCWGANAAGQSGTGTATPSVNAPGAAAVASGASAVAAGGGTSCASTSTGGLLCWGNNAAGQTGRGNTGPAASPAQVTGLPAAGAVVAFAVGASHACANTGATTGLYCWGANGSWQLGDGGASGAASSTAVPASALDNRTRFDGLLTAGGVFTCGARTLETTLKCGGLADDLPVGIPALPPAAGNLVDANDVIPGGVLVSVAAGTSHACALVDVGAAGAPILQIKCWGRNAEGELGRTTLDPAKDGAPGIVPP